MLEQTTSRTEIQVCSLHSDLLFSFENESGTWHFCRLPQEGEWSLHLIGSEFSATFTNDQSWLGTLRYRAFVDDDGTHCVLFPLQLRASHTEGHILSEELTARIANVIDPASSYVPADEEARRLNSLHQSLRKIAGIERQLASDPIPGSGDADERRQYFELRDRFDDAKNALSLEMGLTADQVTHAIRLYNRHVHPRLIMGALEVLGSALD